MSEDEFLAAVDRAKESIAAGDVYQLVLSICFSGRTTLEPFEAVVSESNADAIVRGDYSWDPAYTVDTLAFDADGDGADDLLTLGPGTREVWVFVGGR